MTEEMPFKKDKEESRSVAILVGPNGFVEVFENEKIAKKWIGDKGWKNQKDFNPNAWSLKISNGEIWAELKTYPVHR